MSVDFVNELVEIMTQLRAPDGCPWDRQQTHESLIRFLTEETGEFLDALEEGDDHEMIDELGDILLQVVFHAQIAKEEGRFDLQTVARSECEKMRRRHPHVFGGESVEDAATVKDRWEAIKKQEPGKKRRRSAVDGVPRHLPALHRAEKIQGKAAKVGFEWRDEAGARRKFEEEWGELQEAMDNNDSEAIAEELGDLMFMTVQLARYRGLYAEQVLQDSIRKFERRFRLMEDIAAEEGSLSQSSPDELGALWEKAKKADVSQKRFS